NSSYIHSQRDRLECITESYFKYVHQVGHSSQILTLLYSLQQWNTTHSDKFQIFVHPYVILYHHRINNRCHIEIVRSAKITNEKIPLFNWGVYFNLPHMCISSILMIVFNGESLISLVIILTQPYGSFSSTTSTSCKSLKLVPARTDIRPVLHTILAMKKDPSNDSTPYSLTTNFTYDSSTYIFHRIDFFFLRCIIVIWSCHFNVCTVSLKPNCNNILIE
ncbi:hypothetical protein AGLY_001254, partial [Aphis glycines]